MTYTQEQQDIIHSNDQHIVVVANAGTGKTTTIIEKIKYLLDNKRTFANRIMLTSFSRVAASELYGKASESFGREYADQMSIGTIHSICYKIVMENLKLLGFSTLIVRGDSYLTAIALNRHPGVFESKKDATQSTATYRRYLIDGVYPKRLGDDKFNALVEAQEIMESNNGVLFDDLLLKSVLLLEKNEDIRKNWQSKFDWIMCDEVQDTNELQWKIVGLLSSSKTKTVMIGDAKQNIYQFRGCSYEYLEDYRNKVNAKIFPLTETFRFGQPFADVSNRVVDNLIVPDAYKKHTVTKIDRNTKPEFVQLSEDDQLSNCVEKVRAFIDSGYSYKDMNVVYRYNKEAIPFMKQFMKEKIPFVIKSGDIFERIELKFVMQSVGLLYNFNLNDCISLFSMYSDFVGDKTLTTIYNSIESSTTVIEFLEKAMKTKISGVGAYKKRSLKSMLDRFNDLSVYIKTETNIPRIASIMNIEETKFMLKEEENKNQGNPSEDRMEFLSFFDECFRDSKKESLIDWYNDLVTNGHKVAEKQKDAVNLKTIHGCKGQTLPIVFFISNKIGDSRFVKEEKDLEAEKFCLYVALTRAEKQLIVYNSDPVRFRFPFIFPEEWQEQIKTLVQNEENTSPESTTSNVQETLSKSPSLSDRVIKECFQVTHVTPKAILFSFGKHSFWAPKSSVSFKNNRYFLNKWVVSKNNIERFMEDYK